MVVEGDSGTTEGHVIKSTPQYATTQRYQLTQIHLARVFEPPPDPWTRRFGRIDWWGVMVFVVPWAIVAYLAVALTSVRVG